MGTLREDYEQLLPLVRSILNRLNDASVAGHIARDTWRLKEQDANDWSRYFQATSGKAALWISEVQGTKGQRLNISGILPRGKDGQYVRVYEKGADGNGWNEVRVSDITVSISRGEEAIAKEINRRFLPEYLRVVGLALDKIAADEAYETKRFENLQACASTLNKVLDRPYGHNTRVEDRTEFSEYLGANGAGIRIECKASANDIDLKIDNLSVEQAKQVLALAKHLALPRNLA
jgi:hypothetical protein